MTWELNKLDKLLQRYLSDTKIIKDVKTKKISQPGENYGSIMYSVDITIGNKTNQKDEILHTVAKVLPEGELVRELFNIQTTYPNEMAFYEVIVPTLVDFQKGLGIEKPIDCFAKCYAVRKNLLDNSDIIDDDAVLLLENLVVSGFANIDKVKGFDLETTVMVIKDLAHFHGVCLALKTKKPEVFEKKIKTYCGEFYRKMGVPPEAIPLMKVVYNANKETANILRQVEGWEENKRILPKEPFATLIHDDLWTNNTMQKFKDGKPVANVLVDFQIISYGSPAIDLIFFILSSVPLDLIKTHLDYFIKLYHDNLIEVLKNHYVDVTPFSFQNFLEEIHDNVPFYFINAFFFHMIAIHGGKGGFDLNKPPTVEALYEEATDVAKEKAFYMLKECYRRGWFK